MDTFMKNWSLSAHFIYQTIRRLFIWELIGSLLSVCGRQRPEQKKRFISFQGQLGLRNPQAVRKCNCFSPYCAKTSMKFSIKILTIYHTKYLMMNACIMSFEQVEFSRSLSSSATQFFQLFDIWWSSLDIIDDF